MKLLTFMDKHSIITAVFTCTVVFYLQAKIGVIDMASTIPMELSLIAGLLLYDVLLLLRKIKK